LEENGEESLKLFCDRRRGTEKKKWRSSRMQKVKQKLRNPIYRVLEILGKAKKNSETLVLQFLALTRGIGVQKK
jgi:hypothetical protein